jgi:hypothetical protein
MDHLYRYSRDSTRNLGSNRRDKCGICGLAEPVCRATHTKKALAEVPRNLRRLLGKKFCAGCKDMYADDFHFRRL